MEEIYSVDKLELELEKSLPPNLVIKAEGTVTTGGWSGFELVKVEYVDVPADRIQEYSFVGKKPTGSVTEGFETEKSAIARIEALDTVNYWGKGIALKGIRLRASTNEMTKALA